MAQADRPDSYYDTVGLPRPSSRTGSSWSESAPEMVRTPENDIINAISQVASGLAQQMVGWATGVFEKTSQITDQAVGNFFQVSQQMQGLSNNLTDQYNNVFAPQNRSLAQEANTYNSDARRRADMGSAGAVQAQAGDQALRNAEESLRSYGINPADGRYAALNKAAAVQNAANIAGAMNMQRERTAQVGRDLRTQAVQVGATLPAAIANVNNTGIQANTGASNASLANANTGANLNRLPNEYLRTAMDVKLPPVGQRSSSGSQHAGSGGGAGGGGSGGGGAPRMSMPGGMGGGGSGGMGGGRAWMPEHGVNGSGGGYGGRPSLMQGGSRILSNIDHHNYTGIGNDDGGGAIETYDFSGENNGWFNDYGGYGDQGGFDTYDFSANGWDNVYGGGGDYDQYGGASYSDSMTDGSWGNISYDTGANSYDPGWGQTYDQPASYTDWGSDSGTSWGGGNEAFNDYGASRSMSDSGGDWGSTDWGGSDVYDAYSDQNYYAEGGPVPPSRSPSGGAMVDDVQVPSPQGPANLNVGEFVIPQDVALWKGQEFFQKLIDQSRKHRMTAPAPGPSKQAPQQPMR